MCRAPNVSACRSIRRDTQPKPNAQAAKPAAAITAWAHVGQSIPVATKASPAAETTETDRKSVV